MVIKNGYEKIYIVSVENDEIGEVEGMFDENKELIHWWSRNDANWRSEYFAPILEYFGYKEVDKNPKSLNKKLVEEVKKIYEN